MKFKETTLKGNYLIDNECFLDDRGFFIREFCKNKFYCNSMFFYIHLSERPLCLNFLNQNLIKKVDY